MAEKAKRIIANNKKAYHDYFVDDTFEAGISLVGTEVKSIRAGHVNLKDSYCTVENGQVSVIGMHISPYEKGNIFNKDPLRERKLLLHKREIFKLFQAIKQDGMTIIPLSLYFSGSKVKLEIGVCKGKKQYDKRATDAKKQAARDMDRAKKEFNRA